MRDRASVNDVAMRTIRVVYNQLLDVGCFSHTLDHVGERMNTPILHDVLTKPEIPLVVEDSNWTTCTFILCHSIVESV